MIQQIKITRPAVLMMFCVSIAGCHVKKGVRQLKAGAIKNETSFKNLVECFSSAITGKNFMVTFGSVDNTVYLRYFKSGVNIADTNYHWGGKDLQLHSPEMDKAIQELGWSYGTIDTLINGLRTIGCNYIRNTNWFGDPINIYEAPDGFVNADYNIYPADRLDTVRVVHGEPVGQTDFLKRVYIMTGGAL